MQHAELVKRVIRAYDDPVVRAYCQVRFRILHQRFMREIEQYLPARGVTLDVGCGFGLFSLYFAIKSPGRSILGIDLDSRRIQMATCAAQRLGLRSANYQTIDAQLFRLDQPIDAAYMLDIVHHIPRESVRPLLEQIHDRLPTGAPLIVKDIGRRPAWKMGFTWLLDKMVDFKAPV